MRRSVVGVFALPLLAEIRSFDEHFGRVELGLFREPHSDVAVKRGVVKHVAHIHGALRTPVGEIWGSLLRLL